MEKHYWLHRISHEGALSYPLLEKHGYLTLGWSELSEMKVLEAAKKDRGTFGALLQDLPFRSKWNIWNMAQYQKGDWIVVPQYDKKFSVYEVEAETMLLPDIPPIPALKDWNGTPVVRRDDGFFAPAGKKDGFDLGFACKVRLIARRLDRSAAAPVLQSRMKIRQTNADITKLHEEIERVVKTQTRSSIHEAMLQAALKDAHRIFDLTPDEMENLVAYYMRRIGANSVTIPAKNEAGKEDGADADVVAEFDALKVTVFIQVKKHTGETDAWAERQIARYKQQKEEQRKEKDADETLIPWAITSASFSEDAKLKAAIDGVRLIDGEEFLGMLLDAGIYDIDSILPQ